MEIERKFLVRDAPAGLDAHPSTAIEQGYLAIDGDGTEVRIRRRDGAATMTVKSGGGRTRAEEELALDGATFERLWPLTEGRRIEKVRHVIPTGAPGVEIELDTYGGDLVGLVVAEVEFPGEAEADAFDPPAWLGREVTHDKRFKNQRLAVDGRPDAASTRVPSASQVAHAGLPFANPMAEADVDRALGLLRLRPGALVLDTGCGNGEMLRRALARDPTWRGLGVDLDPDAIAGARARAAERLPGRDVRFEVRDAAEVTGEHDAVLNVGSSHVHGGYPAALAALRRLVVAGGSVIYGEGYWREPPAPAFLEALGGATEDELADIGGLRTAVLDAGFDIVSVVEAGEADWAAYEETLAANAERDRGAETAAYARRIRERRALPGGTSTLGFALLVLRAPGPRAGGG